MIRLQVMKRLVRKMKYMPMAVAGVVLAVGLSATNASSSPHQIAAGEELLRAQAGLNNITVELETQTTFSTLAAVLKATGLNQTLAEGGPFTIFAPTDQAFAILEQNQPGILASLLQPENRDKLTRILLYHVVEGKADSFALGSSRWRVESLAGPPVIVEVNPNFEITVSSTRPAVGDPAKVILQDIPVGNGVIHGIDSVLIPPN